MAHRSSDLTHHHRSRSWVHFYMNDSQFSGSLKYLSEKWVVLNCSPHEIVHDLSEHRVEEDAGVPTAVECLSRLYFQTDQQHPWDYQITSRRLVEFSCFQGCLLKSIHSLDLRDFALCDNSWHSITYVSWRWHTRSLLSSHLEDMNPKFIPFMGIEQPDRFEALLGKNCC